MTTSLDDLIKSAPTEELLAVGKRMVRALSSTFSPHISAGMKAVGGLGLSKDHPAPAMCMMHMIQSFTLASSSGLGKEALILMSLYTIEAAYTTETVVSKLVTETIETLRDLAEKEGKELPEGIEMRIVNILKDKVLAGVDAGEPDNSANNAKTAISDVVSLLSEA